MESGFGSITSPTLLGRLRQQPDDRAAWGEFVERYGRKILGWCRQWKLQESDAQDVAQMVLLNLAGRMRTFAYDPSKTFRGWLRVLTQHAWSDFVDARRRQCPARGEVCALPASAGRAHRRGEPSRRLDSGRQRFPRIPLADGSLYPSG